jgi:hypothetical protein
LRAPLQENFSNNQIQIVRIQKKSRITVSMDIKTPSLFQETGSRNFFTIGFLPSKGIGELIFMG